MADTPLIIKPGTIVTTLAAAGRMLTILIGGFTAIMGFATKHDLVGLTNYFQSSAFLPVAGALAAIISVGYGLWKTWKTKKSLIAVAHAAPDEISIVLGKEKPL